LADLVAKPDLGDAGRFADKAGFGGLADL